MQIIRINSRLPQVYRICQTSPASTRKMSLFPRFVTNEFAPMWRLMDDYANHVISTSGRQGLGASPLASTTSLRSFQPRFDIKENKDSYELYGELPGIEQKDINIEFTDAQTLSIKGRTEHVREEGQRPSGLIEGQEEAARITEGGEQSSYHKPTVEDDGATSGALEKTSESEQEPAKEVTETPSKPESQYWLSERSFGEFSRTFAFPSRVDQDNVKASLKNGILSIVVPKTSAPTSKRINVE